MRSFDRGCAVTSPSVVRETPDHLTHAASGTRDSVRCVTEPTGVAVRAELHLRGHCYRSQRGLEIVGEHRDVPILGGERGVTPTNVFSSSEKGNERRDLAAQENGLDRLKDIVDRSHPLETLDLLPVELVR